MRYLTGIANEPSADGIFFSRPWDERPRWTKPWNERPWWSKAKDIVSVSIIGTILLVVVWEAVRRWLGY